MTVYIVRAPEPVTENIVGVPFVEGVARNVNDENDLHRRALEYFRKAGYIVEPPNDADAAEQDPTVQPVAGGPIGGPDVRGAEQIDGVDAEPNPPVNAPDRTATKAAWKKYVTSDQAGDRQLTADEAEQLTRDQIADHVYGPDTVEDNQ
jgi:hypothetical protein